MANSIKPRPLEPLLAEFKRLGFSDYLVRAMRDLLTRSDLVLTNQGAIQAQANITGRSEQISVTTQNIDASGVLLGPGADFSRAYLNKTTDNITDGTGSPLTGGKRGFQALDTNNRIVNSFHGNAVNAANSPTSSTTLSNDGIATAITIAASSSQFGAGLVSYNSGSVDPGSFGKSFITASDPTFAGGAVTYTFTATAENQVNTDGKVPLGSITTVNGSAKTGGGKSGGSGGQAGGRGVLQ